MDPHEKDRRFQKLSSAGAVGAVVTFALALTCSASPNWATVHGSVNGYMSPWKTCQYTPSGSAGCRLGGLRDAQQSWASYVAGIGSAACTVLLGLTMVLAPLIAAMHTAKHQICCKFRHATFCKMIFIGIAALFCFIAIVCFVLETKVFIPGLNNGIWCTMNYAFYLQVLVLLLCAVLGVGASTEWKWSRRVGGDPTIYSRDPEGNKAETIVNQNFRDAPRNGSKASHTGSSRSGGMHRNPNGVAMTHLSGQPYMMSPNGMPPSRGLNGHLTNGRGHNHIAFDPNRTPLRSSLRRPKAQTSIEDSADGDLAINNPSFTANSPTPKKKVRIHTQSTAV